MKRIAATILLWLGLVTPALATVTCPAAVTGISPSATSCWPMQETTGTAITDTIDSNSGTIGGSYTLNQNGGIECSNSTTGADGLNGCNITTTVNYSNPQPMTAYFDFAGTSGGIAQLATSSGTSGSPYYVLFLDNHGKITFGVNNFSTYEVLQSPQPYADGNEHKVVVSVGALGMKLYVDGSLVASRNVTLANYVNGYWFLGGINTAGWQLSPSYANFNGTLYTSAWWNGTQLTDAQAVTLTGGNPTAISNSYCTFSNQIASLNPATSQAFANSNLTFTTTALQVSGGGSVLPIAPSRLVCKTDSTGTILSGCQVQQGAHVTLSVGSGPPIPLVIPFSTSCDLSAIILSQTDPPEVVSAVAVAGPLFAGATVTNPPAGTIGTATITGPSAFSQTQASAATVNIGTNGNVQQVIMTGDVAISLTNFASGANFYVDTTQDGTGGRTPTFSVPAGWSLVWTGGGAQPVLPSSAASTHTIWQFVATNGTQLSGAITSFSTSSGTFPLSATANFNNYSGTNVNTLNSTQLTAPTPSLAATCGGTCATTYTYELVCLGDNSTHTTPSAQQTAVNAASLDASHYNTLTWTAGTGCHSGYAVYGRIGGSLGLLSDGTLSSSTLTYTDTGVATVGAVPPTTNTTGAFNVGGNNVVSGNLSVTGTSTLTGGVSGNLSVAGTVTSGTNGGTGGKLTLNGATSGAAAIAVAAAAGTPTALVLPTANGTAGQTIVNDGSANLSWSSIGGSAILTSTSLSTWTIPTGVTAIDVTIVGGGGGGGGGDAGAGGGGAGGNKATCLITGLTPGGTLSYQVGPGGPGGAASGAGTAGTATVFDNLSLNGGGAGASGATGVNGTTPNQYFPIGTPTSGTLFSCSAITNGTGGATSTGGGAPDGGAGGAAGANPGVAGTQGYIHVTW